MSLVDEALKGTKYDGGNCANLKAVPLSISEKPEGGYLAELVLDEQDYELAVDAKTNAALAQYAERLAEACMSARETFATGNAIGAMGILANALVEYQAIKAEIEGKK